MAHRHLRTPILLSILAALLTLGLKYLAYHLTGSIGLLSDAAESLVNLVAALTAFVCLEYASRPVDPTHTYGHEKIEFFSSGLEGILILAAGGGIAWYTVQRLFALEDLNQVGLGLAVSTVASLINLGVALLLLRAGRKHQSIVLEADGKHLLTDVWVSAGVLVGVGLVRVTGWTLLDPLCALLMGVNIAWTGFDLLRRSFDGLMDHALPEEEQAAVRRAIEAELAPGTTYHALRTRRAGARRFVDFHLLVPGATSVSRAHALTNRIEEAVKALFPTTAEVTVHIEPIEDRDAWEDSALLAIEQAARQMRTERPHG